MLKISKLTDYASLCVDFLARYEHELSARSISEQLGLGLATVRKVLKLLQAAGIVASIPGTKGGYRLARPSHEIYLSDLIRAIEGEASLGLTDCSSQPGSCRYEACCHLKTNWMNVSNYLLEELGKISMADMAKPFSKQLQSFKNINIQIKPETMTEVRKV